MFGIFRSWQKELEETEKKLQEANAVIDTLKEENTVLLSNNLSAEEKKVDLTAEIEKLKEENEILKKLVEEYKKESDREIGKTIDEFINGDENDRMEVQPWGGKKTSKKK